jgi:starch synthase
VLFVGSEMWPYASAGGMSRVLYYLPQALTKLGVDARVFIPKYGKMDQTKFKLKKVYDQLHVPLGDEHDKNDIICNVLTNQQPGGPVTYFLENQEYYELRANVYGYSDDHIRWGVLQKGMWEFLHEGNWIPDIIHCNDWHTGLVANFFDSQYRKEEKLESVKTVFTIHNLIYQAPFDHRFMAEQDKDMGLSPVPGLMSAKFGKLNSMRRGIIYSDLITAVSPTYVSEILTEEYGEGLDSLLLENKSKLIGIINGLDYGDYNPRTDTNLEQNYKKGEWISRAMNKSALQKQFALEVRDDIPMYGISYRLTPQKGLDLIIETIETIMEEFEAQLVVNGDGDDKYKEYFFNLAKKYPKQVAVNLQFNEKLPRLIFAGADFLLHPSKFEPCGIVQMEAMAYGCVPIVRKVGGLADTVTDGENGFVFTKFEANALLVTLARSAEVFKHKEVINKMRTTCMNEDFSWKVSAEKYLRSYKDLIGVK